MENPEHEIRYVVRSLTQGTPDEQRRTLERYFTPDASFVHPFCTVPSFQAGAIPLSSFSSRHAVLSIFQWYRMMSPRIEIEIDAVLLDKARDKLFLDMRQVFTMWFIPFAFPARVRLVTVLDLVASDDPDYHDPLDRIVNSPEHEEKTENAGDEKTAGVSHQQHHQGDEKSSRVWRISRQEDLYQVNEFLRFLQFPPLPYLWWFFQLCATIVCFFLALFVRLSPWAFQKDPARGGVEATIRQVEEGEYHDMDGASSTSSKAEGKAHAEDGDEAGSTNSGSRGESTGAANNHSKPLPKKPWKNGKKNHR